MITTVGTGAQRCFWFWRQQNGKIFHLQKETVHGIPNFRSKILDAAGRRCFVLCAEQLLLKEECNATL